MKHSKVIAPRQISYEPSNKLKKIVGKKVIGKNGEVVGKVKSLIGSLNKIEGIVVKNKSITTFIDYVHIQDLYSTSVMLKIDPISRIIGMLVFDSEGKKLGYVLDFVQTENKNNYSEIIVKKNKFAKKKSIPADSVEVSNKNIILNTTHNE